MTKCYTIGSLEYRLLYKRIFIVITIYKDKDLLAGQQLYKGGVCPSVTKEWNWSRKREEIENPLTKIGIFRDPLVRLKPFRVCGSWTNDIRMSSVPSIPIGLSKVSFDRFFAFRLFRVVREFRQLIIIVQLQVRAVNLETH